MNNFCSLPITDQDIDEFNIWFKKRSNDFNKYKAIKVNINSGNQPELSITRSVDALKHYYDLFFILHLLILMG